MEFNYKFPVRLLRIAEKTGKFIEPTILRDVIGDALSITHKMARANSPVLSGFMKDHMFVYLTDNFTGWFASEAEYSAAVERGYRTKSGRWVAGRHFIVPAIEEGKKKFFANMQLFAKAFIEGNKPNIPKTSVSTKSGVPGVAIKPTRGGFARQATVTKRLRPPARTGVSHTSFKNVQRMGLGRFFPKQRIGGRSGRK